MTTFLRLLEAADKATELLDSCDAVRANSKDLRCFEVAPISFKSIPGAPFAYWVSENLRESFTRIEPLESNGRIARAGANTNDNFRFVRSSWEIQDSKGRWRNFCKGGSFSRYYSDPHLLIDWQEDGAELKAYISELRGKKGWGYQWSAALNGYDHYFRPGLSWPLRTQSGLNLRAVPRGCIFGHKGPMIFIETDNDTELLALLAITNSRPFSLLISLSMSFGSYEVGVLKKTPVAHLDNDQEASLAAMARRAWSLKRTGDTIDETSHGFHLPALLQARLGIYDPQSIEAELADIQAEIDGIAFALYGFSEADRAAALGSSCVADEDESDEAEEADDSEDDDEAQAVDLTDGLLSWATGVAVGRFDWRLATGESDAPPEPDPFDPLPAKSPGMLPDGAAPFHPHTGILVDDQGHSHDLPRLIEEVLARVQADVPGDVRRWLQRDFFQMHLKLYSKSRRKAPIYWPLSTASGTYTLWLYYPSLTSQTLYTAINDLVEPKLKQIAQDIATLRAKGSARSRDDEKSFEALQALELELIELRDMLLQIAPTYLPNHDDGVQITAAPLWRLFRHAPWQKLLKETWAKLEKGDYDWAHLAFAYWPERARQKCKTDKSLAIAHNLEGLYVEPDAQSKKSRGKKKAGGDQ